MTQRKCHPIINLPNLIKLFPIDECIYIFFFWVFVLRLEQEKKCAVRRKQNIYNIQFGIN